MIYTTNTKLALKICFELHKDQMDKGNSPFVFHPFHLAEQMPDEDSCVVALLHDVIEDTACTLEDLKNFGFNSRVIKAIELITYKKGTDYFAYISSIKTNFLATLVKVADLQHNMDASRLDQVTLKDEKRIEKYKQALQLLYS
ncbi:MAG: hypothetical protein K2I42_02210 [Anaeroplasmataceae bacterium]|nr:hypothetical protein [Anaeroplasmataceae bacterium]